MSAECKLNDSIGRSDSGSDGGGRRLIVPECASETASALYNIFSSLLLLCVYVVAMIRRGFVLLPRGAVLLNADRSEGRKRNVYRGRAERERERVES